MISENPHWTKERWEQEKQNTINCLNETSQFIEENKNIGSETIDTTTVEGFNEVQKKTQILEKLQMKKDYVLQLQSRLNDIDEKILSLN